MLDEGWLPGPPHLSRRGVGPRLAGVLVVLVLAGALVAALLPANPPNPPAPTLAPRPAGTDLAIAGSAPTAWDPARIGDAGSSAMLAQVDETLTATDAQNRVQPALASGWALSADARQITFTLRGGIVYSDGRPITANDVVNSWMRVIDPRHPSPLASLLGDVQGASEYLAGSGPASGVGIVAQGDQVVVSFRRPAAYFPAVVSSPTFGIVPPDLPTAASGAPLPSGLVVSGAYVPDAETDTAIHLTANPRYWAGEPAIHSIQVLTDFGGASPVDAFEAGTIDFVPIAEDDATWIRYDRVLGPQLRRAEDLSVSYYGFDVTKPPFDSVDVRRAFAAAVNWHRIVQLDDATAAPATSIVPEGLDGHGTSDYTPAYDVAAAQADLARAAYPGGRGFPAVTILSSGGFYEEAVARQLTTVLGITVTVEVMPFDQYSARLDEGAPARMWSLDWVADYPSAQDFLGLLLTTGSKSNVGGWSNTQYDAAIAGAATEVDPARQAVAYDTAQRILQDQVPVIPLRYGLEWDLSRAGLLGANEGGTGIIRFAGLAWGNR